MKILISIFSVFASCVVSLNAWAAADKTVDLVAPRGSLIKIDIYNPGLPSVLLLAPGSGCGSRRDMYAAFAAEAKNKGMTLVRLYWAYCVSKPEGHPSQELAAEKEDLAVAFDYTKQTLGYSDAAIFVGGKSMGSFISYDLFRVQTKLPGLVLLTPVCTSAKDPAHHKNKFAENYPELSQETRPVLLVQGNADPYCDTVHFQEYLKNKPSNFISLVTTGDHSFAIKNPDGQDDADLGLKNIQAISRWIFTWLK
jgi:predicted alpha/beta-hydrolase family hydrolase